MSDLEKLRYINCGIAKRVLVPNDIKEVIVAEVNIKALGEIPNKAIIDYCVNVDANNFDFF